jgi:hypothetical protein
MAWAASRLSMANSHFQNIDQSRLRAGEGGNRNARRSDRPTRVRLSSKSRAWISAFQPQSTLDQEAILALLKVNADQVRLGGLFKLWLSGQNAPSAKTVEIRMLLTAIEERQPQLKALIAILTF